jgi:hypothetical protein
MGHSELNGRILGLEQVLLDPTTRASAATLNILLADDFMEIGASGQIHNKADTVASLPEETADWTYLLSDFAIRQLSSDTVLATYRIVTFRKAASERRTLRSSIWRRENGAWRMIFHQGTLAP